MKQLAIEKNDKFYSVNLEFNLIELKMLHNLCNELLEDHPEMIGYKDLRDKILSIVVKYKKDHLSQLYQFFI